MARPRKNTQLTPNIYPTAAEETAPDMVNQPPHYQSESGLECIDAIKAQLTAEEYTGFLRGTIAAYQWRLGKKGSALEDARKAGWYHNKLVEHLADLDGLDGSS